MKGPRIDDRINFLRGIERDWKDWSAGKNKTPLDIFVGVLTATGMLILASGQAIRGLPWLPLLLE